MALELAHEVGFSALVAGGTVADLPVDACGFALCDGVVTEYGAGVDGELDGEFGVFACVSESFLDAAHDSAGIDGGGGLKGFFAEFVAAGAADADAEFFLEGVGSAGGECEREFECGGF